MEIEIRDAEQKDVGHILEIVNDAILNTTANYDYHPHDLDQQMQWYENLKSSGMPVIVAEADGEVIAFASYGSFRTKEGYKYSIEHSIYIQQSYRGKGIGSKLLDILIDRAKEQGFHTMVGVIDYDNKSSIHFHEKAGFIQTGILHEIGYKFDRFLDIVFMQLKLN
jgi:phosphinothricin acetyltransferase